MDKTQQTATGLYFERHEPSPHPHTLLLVSILILSFPLYLSFPSEYVPSHFPAKYFYAYITLMHATCLASLILTVTKIRGFNGGEIVDCWIMTSCCLVWLPGFRRSMTEFEKLKIRVLCSPCKQFKVYTSMRNGLRFSVYRLVTVTLH